MAWIRDLRSISLASAVIGLSACTLSAGAQTTPSRLPPTAPTSFSSSSSIAPIAAVAGSGERAGAPHHRARVNCAGGELAVHADNSSLNGILRSISQCTGMKITGGVADQRVFGDYGPAAPATVLATLLDGTGSNMLLSETAAAQPALLILTPRTGGATPPGPLSVADDDVDEANTTGQPASGPKQPSGGPSRMNGARQNGFIGNIANPIGTPQATNAQGAGAAGNNPNQTPVPQSNRGSAVTSPPSIPQPLNNVNGSPNSVSPTASTYPTTNSVPLDSLPTPSTTPSSDGIVDAPNPPAPGSDTSRLLQGTTSTAPGTTNIVDAPTSDATSPGGTNTTTPVPTGSVNLGADSNSATPNGNGTLTPQQVYQQLQQIRQQQQQQQSPTTPAPQ
ncbi:MAG: hypothetical protein ACRYFU_13700 [Janthinobacterium lividum]